MAAAFFPTSNEDSCGTPAFCPGHRITAATPRICLPIESLNSLGTTSLYSSVFHAATARSAVWSIGGLTGHCAKKSGPVTDRLFREELLSICQGISKEQPGEIEPRIPRISRIKFFSFHSFSFPRPVKCATTSPGCFPIFSISAFQLFPSPSALCPPPSGICPLISAFPHFSFSNAVIRFGSKTPFE